MITRGERYAAEVYTGKPRRVGMYDCGAECWEWPATRDHYGSRSPQRYFAYPGCQKCGGRGARPYYSLTSNKWAQGQCPACKARALASYNRHAEIRKRIAEIEHDMVVATRRVLPGIKTVSPVERLPKRPSKPGTADKYRDPNEALATDAGESLWALAREWRALVEEYQSGQLPMRSPRLVKTARTANGKE